jgi:ubiquitin carboxyl-terminal hydrolase 4/11
MSEVNLIFESARKYIDDGDIVTSINILSTMDTNKFSVNTYIKRADLYWQLKCPDKAEEDLSFAYTLANKDPDTRKKFITTILNKRISINESLEKYTEALRDNLELYEVTQDPNLIKNRQKLAGLEREAKLKIETGEFLMIFKSNLETKPGSEWHVVSLAWFEKWQKYVKIFSFFMEEEIPFKVVTKHTNFCEDPGPIDNTDIIDEEQTNIILEDPSNPYTKICLKKGMAENLTYILLPAPAFEYLSSIYTCKVDIKRYAIEVNDTMYQVEVYLKTITIAVNRRGNLETNLINISRKDTIESLKKTYLNLKNISTSNKVWKISLSILSMEKLQALMSTRDTVYLEGGKILADSLVIDDAEIGEQDLILIETLINNKFLFTDDNKKVSECCGFCQKRTKLQVVCSTCKSVKYCNKICQTKHSNDHNLTCKPSKRSLLRCFCRNSIADDSDAVIVPIDSTIKFKSGLTGLQNLGNTCFMNAAIQCLSHTNEITEIFLTGKYNEYLNKTNPLGTNGKLALAYAELLENLWRGTSSSFPPWKLKRIVSLYAPQFVGYQQHDSQELLGFLLDRLHEDLNLIKKKTYFEDNNITGSNDEEVARESWRRHTLRNQSIIVDLAHGQYKSSLYCPSCKQYSYTFDPFNSITLPLPQSQEKVQNFYFIFYDPIKPPYSMACEYQIGDTLEQVSKEISRLLEIESTSYVFFTILNDVVKEILPLKKSIESLRNFTLFAYEIKDKNSEIIELQVVIEKNKLKTTSYSRIICLTSMNTFRDLHHEVFIKFRHHFPRLNSKNKIQEVYEELLASPAYVIYFVPYKDSPCPLCRDKPCKGCPIPYSNDKLKKIFSNGRVIIELAWKYSYNNFGANLQDLNRCTEHISVSDISQKSRKNPVRLEECFDLFRVPELLEKENAWYCPNCKTDVQATKKLEIYKVPPILIIHIKRFKVNGHTKEKLYNPVIFPETGLDIKEWVIGSEKPGLYDLYAVCNHFGNLSGGHYTATCYSTLNRSWFDFKDSQVVPSTENNSASAYVLFYRARK